jgi:hypothetical protein
MRLLLVGLMVGLLAWGTAIAEEPAGEGYDENAEAAIAVEADAAAAAESQVSFAVPSPAKREVTGIPLYDGPSYSSLDSERRDVNNIPREFHAFQHRPVDEVGYSPLTLEDFRFPVPKRTQREFIIERLAYPQQAVTVWKDDCHKFSVTAFFFTRDMIRDHIQRLIDEYYVCDADTLQQVIDYYAEVTPQCGEAISWVWFSVDGPEVMKGGRENRYVANYLSNFKDKFHLEFGLPKVQDKIDTSVHNFLYQYQKRGKYACGPEFKPLNCQIDGGCAACLEQPCPQCVKGGPDCLGNETCACCPAGKHVRADKQLVCTDFQYKGFGFNPNEHYLYYPRKVVIEDITFDPVARAYRWKFAWRFTDCELDWLKAMCGYGLDSQMALVISDPTWYSHKVLDSKLERNILAAADPTTWGNVWPAGNLPFDTSCCPCQLPGCPGNCAPKPPAGWALPPVAAAVPEPIYEQPEPVYEPEPEPETQEVIGNG